MAAQNLLERRFPKSARHIDEIKPFRSLIGTIIFFIGLFELVELLFRSGNFFWRLLSACVMIGIGYVQGFVNVSSISRSIGLNWNLNHRFEQLVKYQETLGIIGLLLVSINVLRKFNIIF